MKTKVRKQLPRASGVLMHISSLPSDYGVGDFGPAAYHFADFLAQTGQSFWQILPLNPTDPIYGNSPYSSNSAFAMSLVFVSPELLLKAGWVTADEIKPGLGLPKDTVDYPAAMKFKVKLLSQAYDRVKPKLAGLKEFQEFCREQAAWLDDYALFVVLKCEFLGEMWTRWPQEIKAWDKEVIKDLRKKHRQSIEQVKFVQYVAFKQFAQLKAYCNSKKIQIVGDIPIYVNDDSVDVWANPDIFKLDENWQPAFVAGVPPDYFSQTGQRWGNPVYDWDYLKELDYEWWMLRLRHNLALFDILRIDHFRAFVDYWEIPSSSPTAVTGEWVQGPGDDFLNTILKNFPDAPIIAEDLGILSPAVPETIARFQFLGMKILLFAFGGELESNPYTPDKYPANCVAYSGTHDNNTIYGWWNKDASMAEKKNLALYLRRQKIKRTGPMHWALIEMLMNSKANLVLIPLQDILGLDETARMNRPGTASGNWGWRLAAKTIDPTAAKKFKQLTEAAKR